MNTFVLSLLAMRARIRLEVGGEGSLVCAAFRSLSLCCLCVFPVCASTVTTAFVVDYTMAEGVECCNDAAVGVETPAGVGWCLRMVLGEDES